MNLEDYLVEYGYHREDALEATIAFIGGGIKGVEKFAKEWAPSDEPLYADELVGCVKIYLKQRGIQ